MSFGAVQVEKVESLGAAHTEKWGLSGGTYPYCPKVRVPPAPSKWGYPPPGENQDKNVMFLVISRYKGIFQ